MLYHAAASAYFMVHLSGSEILLDASDCGNGTTGMGKWVNMQIRADHTFFYRSPGGGGHFPLSKNQSVTFFSGQSKWIASSLWEGGSMHRVEKVFGRGNSILKVGS